MNEEITTKTLITIFVIVLSVVLVYQFIIRPIQMDNKLEKCLYGAGVSSDVDLDSYKNFCFKKYGK